MWEVSKHTDSAGGQSSTQGAQHAAPRPYKEQPLAHIAAEGSTDRCLLPSGTVSSAVAELFLPLFYLVPCFI